MTFSLNQGRVYIVMSIKKKKCLFKLKAFDITMSTYIS